MKIELPVAELKKALPGLGRVIGRASTSPVLRTVKVKCDANIGTVVEATNLDDFVSVRVGSFAETGEILVPYDHLNEIAKACSAGQTIEVIAANKDTVLRYPIDGSHVERQVEFMSPKEWPFVPACSEPGITVTEELKNALKSAFGCSSTDPSRYVLQGACLDVTDPKAHYVVGTNGQVLFSTNSFNFSLKESLIIPNRKFLHWKEFVEDGDWQLSSTPLVKNKGRWLQFKSDRWTFITKQVEGQYPNWKQVIPNDTPTTVVRFNDEAVQFLLSAIPKLPNGENDVHDTIRFIVNETVLVQAKGNGADWTSLPVVGALGEGNPTTIGVNRNYVLQALKCGLNELELRPDTHAVFKSGGKRFVVALLRMEQSTASPVATSPSTNPQQPNERSSMPKEAAQVETAQAKGAVEAKTSFELLQEQVEAIKDTLKGVVTQLNDTLRTVGQAYKEKRASEKEIQTIRESLREIQQMKI